jgi:hypothetical protein
MSEYAKIWKRVWKDPDFVRLPAATQTLYFLLISSEARSNAGVLPLTIRRWAKCSGDATPDTVRAALSELASHNFTVVDWDTEEVLIRTFIRNDEGWKIHTVMKGILRSVAQTESVVLRQALKDELLRLPDNQGSHALANSLVTHPHLGVSDTPSDTPSEGYPIGNAITAVEGCCYVSREENNLQPSNFNLQPPLGGAGGALVVVQASEAPTKSSPRRKGTRIPSADWMPQQKTVDRIKAAFPHATSDQIRSEHERFICWATGSASRNAVKLDWDMTWAGWMRRELVNLPTSRTSVSKTDQGIAETQALKQLYATGELA